MRTTTTTNNNNNDNDNHNHNNNNNYNYNWFLLAPSQTQTPKIFQPEHVKRKKGTLMMSGFQQPDHKHVCFTLMDLDGLSHES